MSQPLSLAQLEGHVGGDCAVALVQICAGYGPHALASMPAQPESSCTDAVVHWKVGEQTPSTRVPWQVPGVSHTGAWSYALQSFEAAQQSPLAQQKPFWQWPPWHSALSRQTPPSG